VNIIGFNDYTAVRPCDYPGLTHYDLYDPASYQSYSEITCWGQLPNAPDDRNAATVNPGAPATFKRIDVSTMETHHMGTGGDIPVDPGVDRNDEICAVDHDQSLTCEIQNPEQSYGDNMIHGFYLSEQESRAY